MEEFNISDGKLSFWDQESDIPNIRRLSHLLQTNAVGIRMLSFNYYSLDPTDAVALANAFKNNTTVRTLVTMHGNFDVMVLSEALKVNATIRNLELLAENIGDEGAEALAQALMFNHSVGCLNLFSNNIGHVGASALVEVLHINTTLHSLYLNNNRIGPTGAAALADVLKVNSTLRILDLTNNKIGSVGAATLAGALVVNRTLCGLNLSENNIGDKGAIAVADALMTNTSLSSLELRLNQIFASGIMALSNALRVNITLHTLDLYCNSIYDTPSAVALADALKLNTTLCNVHPGYGMDEKGIAAWSELLQYHNAALEYMLHPTFRTKETWLQRNITGKERAYAAAATTYQVFRLRLHISRDMSRLLSQYVRATQGQMCWVLES